MNKVLILNKNDIINRKTVERQGHRIEEILVCDNDYNIDSGADYIKFKASDILNIKFLNTTLYFIIDSIQ